MQVAKIERRTNQYQKHILYDVMRIFLEGGEAERKKCGSNEWWTGLKLRSEGVHVRRRRNQVHERLGWPGRNSDRGHGINDDDAG